MPVELEKRVRLIGEAGAAVGGARDGVVNGRAAFREVVGEDSGGVVRGCEEVGPDGAVEAAFGEDGIAEGVSWRGLRGSGVEVDGG